MQAFHPRNVVVVNERAFQRLAESIRKAVIEAAATAEKRGRDMARQTEGVRNKTLADNGMSVVDPDPAMRTQLTRIGDTMLTEWTKKAGADGEAMIKAYRAK